jgi:hypothetical protein
MRCTIIGYCGYYAQQTFFVLHKGRSARADVVLAYEAQMERHGRMNHRRRHRRAAGCVMLDLGVSSCRLLAHFDDGGLRYAAEIEGAHRAWRRDRGETGDGFERRVIGHLLADDEALAA